MAENTITMRASDNSIVRLECHTELESTVELAREYAMKGYPDRYAVICEKRSEKETDTRKLYISCILRPSIFPSQAGLLSSLATVAMVTGLEEHTTKRLGIGWVSNVYCEGKMIGNVSIEGKLDNYTSYEYIIVNFTVRLSADDFPPRLADLVKKVFESDNVSVAAIIAKSILNKFFPLYVTMKSNTKFMNIYRQKFILTGMKIKHITDGRKESCRVVGINTDYCTLLVKKKNGKVEEIKTPAKVIIPKYVKLPKK